MKKKGSKKKSGKKTTRKAGGRITKKKGKNTVKSRAKPASSEDRKLLAAYEFEYTIFGVFSREEKALREHLSMMVEDLMLPSLQGPLFAMTHELIANGLKAMHKKVFIREYLRGKKPGHPDYEDWLQLFKSEMDAREEEKYARIFREQNMGVRVSGRLEKDRFRITVVNQGVPGNIEYERLKRSMEWSKRPSFSLSDSLDRGQEDDKHREGGGIGIQMIVFCLRNLGVNPRNFNIFIEQNSTIARIDLPLSLFASVFPGA